MLKKIYHINSHTNSKFSKRKKIIHFQYSPFLRCNRAACKRPPFTDGKLRSQSDILKSEIWIWGKCCFSALFNSIKSALGHFTRVPKTWILKKFITNLSSFRKFLMAQNLYLTIFAARNTHRQKWTPPPLELVIAPKIHPAKPSTEW